jgi:RNA polymerase sigma-70 factor, ECF subfamily
MDNHTVIYKGAGKGFMDLPVDPKAALDAAKQGDLVAYNSLVRKHQDAAFTLAFYMLGDENAAVEVAQAAFLAAYQKLDRFNLNKQPNHSAASWFLSWVVKICLDQPAAALDGRISLPYDVCRQLHQLSPECRLAVILVDLLGLDYREAASAGGMKRKQLLSCLARGRISLIASSSAGSGGRDNHQ